MVWIFAENEDKVVGSGGGKWKRACCSGVKLFEADQLGRRDMRLKGVAGVKKGLIMSSTS